MNNRCNLRLTILLGATVVWSSINGLARAEESATVPTNPGFNGYTGQINPGSTHPVTSQSKEVTNIPTPEESRQALLEPYSKQPSLGNSPSVPRPEPPPSGPIGSFGQTIPAKFSKRNDILDRTPIMGWPLPLTDQQRTQIVDAVMSDTSQPVAGADALKPASELSPDQALSDMRPLPESVRSIDGVEHLYYLKAPHKILLVEPATRTVVGEIES